MVKNYAIDIAVEKNYIAEESVPERAHYVFSYTISIRNTGAIGAKLLRRHWWIANEAGQMYEVEGEGVVGEQPMIEPGKTFSYTSGTVINTPVGTMQGRYEMIGTNGELLEVDIPMFTLAAPGRLH